MSDNESRKQLLERLDRDLRERIAAMRTARNLASVAVLADLLPHVKMRAKAYSLPHVNVRA